MFSDQIDETIKGIAYAREPRRMRRFGNCATFRGHHRPHILIFSDSEWICDCKAWRTQWLARGNGWCRHTIAVERILNPIQNERVMILQAEAVLA